MADQLTRFFATKWRGFVFRICHPVFEKLLLDIRAQWQHPRHLVQAQCQKEAADYIQANMPKALIFELQSELLHYCLKRTQPNGLYLEFGVATGTSINLTAKALPKQTIHGFDSFEGLPEDWPGRHEAKGHYSLGGKLPKVRRNVKLHQGWFNKTLPPFLETEQSKVSFVHLDADLYSSTIFVLDALKTRIIPGTVILFDEYFNFPSWKEHEHKAFQEFTTHNKIKYEYIGWAFQQVAVVITEVGN